MVCGLLLLAWGPVLSACRSTAESEADKQAGRSLSPASIEEALRDAPLPEEERPGTGPSKCAPVSGTSPFVIAGGKQSGGGAVEFSQGVVSPSGFAVGILRAGEASEALVAHVGIGGLRETSLGRAFGPTAPPKVASAGSTLVVAVSDNDATNSTLRLARVAPSGSEVIWGPEVGRGRSEAVDFSLGLLPKAQGVLVWDELDRASARGRIQGLAFDARSMKSVGSARVLTGASEDTESPLIVAGEDGFWLLYVSYEPGKEVAGSDPVSGMGGLVETAPQRLFVRRLNAEGKPRGEPLPISQGLSISLVFDGVGLAGGRLLVAFRQVPFDRPGGAVPIALAWLSPDGSLERGQATTEEELGPGSPLLLTSGEERWLSVGGLGGRVLLGKAEGTRLWLEEEPSLFGRIPLAGSADRLLVARPRALDLDLELFACGG